MFERMATEKQLFHQEFGAYFAAVSPNTRVGVCVDCLTLRTRLDLDPDELCPAKLLPHGFRPPPDAKETCKHNWRGFTDRKALEAFVRDNFPRFRELAAQAESLLPDQSPEADPLDEASS